MLKVLKHALRLPVMLTVLGLKNGLRFRNNNLVLLGLNELSDHIKVLLHGEAYSLIQAIIVDIGIGRAH